MKVFENKLINEQEYNGVLVPKQAKSDCALILSDGKKDDIIITANTSTWDVVAGKYKKLVQVSLMQQITEIRFVAPSKELGYSFEVYVMLIFRVVNPMIFYKNKDIHIDSYLKNLIFLEVKNTIGDFSILDYNKINSAVGEFVSDNDTIDNVMGISYRISAIDIKLGEGAMQYVQQYSKQKLEAELHKNANEIAKTYSRDYADAIMSEVVRGNRTLVEALTAIETHEKERIYIQINMLTELRDKGILTNEQMKDLILQEIKKTAKNEQAVELKQQDSNRITSIDDYYEEE